jgi:hypothetical protein
VATGRTREDDDNREDEFEAGSEEADDSQFAGKDDAVTASDSPVTETAGTWGDGESVR